MADNPDIQWALKLLEPYEEKHPLYKYGSYIGTFCLGWGFGLYLNMLRKRPLFSGIQQHFLYGALFSAVFGHSYVTYCNARESEKAAVVRDYIIRHPEDFHEAPPKKIADILDPWLPIR